MEKHSQNKYLKLMEESRINNTLVNNGLAIFRYFIIFVSVVLISCKNNECQKLIYEISEKNQKEILNELKLRNFNKVIVQIDIDRNSETINLCFQNIYKEDKLLSEFYNKSNRYLKISETVFLPVIFSEDIILAKSKHISFRTGCNFNYQINLDDK